MNRPVIGGAELPHHSGTEEQALCEKRRRLPYFANGPVIAGAKLSHHSGTEPQALCEQRRRLPYFVNKSVIRGTELSHHSAEQQALCEQRQRLPYFANRPVIAGAELSHHSGTEQQVLCEHRRRLPYFANRPVIADAELSHHSTEQQVLCEQRRRLPYFADRTDVGGAELSHDSTDQQEQRARIPHSRASRKSIDRVEGSNQIDCQAVQFIRYPTEAESTQLEYMHREEQTEGPRRQGQVEPPVQQPEVSRLVPVDARKSGWSARSRLPYGETRRRKTTERMVQQWHVQKRQNWTRSPRLTRKRRTAVHASKHLHRHDPRKTRSRGRRSSTGRRILGRTTDRLYTQRYEKSSGQWTSWS